MSEHENEIEWFLARDGQQHGPLTDREMRKLVELGHLRPADLVWRQGFPEWLPAPKVFPPAPRPVPAPPPPRSPAPAQVGSGSGPGPAAQPAGYSPHPADLRRTERHHPGAAGPAHGAVPQGQPGAVPAPARGSQAQPSPQATYDRGMGRAPDPYAGGQPQPRQPQPGPKQPHPQQQPYPGGDPRLRNPAPADPAAGAVGARFQPAGPAAAGPSMASAGPGRGEPRFEPESEPVADDRPRRRMPWLRIAAVLIGAVAIGAGAAFWVKGRISLSSLPQLIAGNATPEQQTPVVRAPKEAAKEASREPTTTGSTEPAAKGIAAAPFVGLGGSGAEIDAALQASTLWQILKREFPDWYGKRIEDVRRLRTEQKDDKAVGAALTDAIVKLRREHANAALAASHARLRVVAETFVVNLDRLAKHSTEACYGFISSGEADPVVIDLLRSPELTKPLQSQLAAVFEAISEGRKSPQAHAKAQRADFDTLAAQLGRRGWSAQDLQLFSDERALSRAPPERVCKMVQEWFAAQLSVPDEATQIRLLVETLRPVVAG